jgi:hypothetical protein
VTYEGVTSQLWGSCDRCGGHVTAVQVVTKLLITCIVLVTYGRVSYGRRRPDRRDLRLDRENTHDPYRKLGLERRT